MCFLCVICGRVFSVGGLRGLLSRLKRTEVTYINY